MRLFLDIIWRAIAATTLLYLAGAPFAKADPLFLARPYTTVNVDFMSTGGHAPPTAASVFYCERYPGDCERSKPQVVRFDDGVKKDLIEVNAKVNNVQVKPVRDQAKWGQADYWDQAEDGEGDCEEFALVKRLELMKRGFPHSALLLAVVLDKVEEIDSGHMVLVVRTTAGEFVMDNVVARVLPIRESPHIFIKMQVSGLPREWTWFNDYVPVQEARAP